VAQLLFLTALENILTRKIHWRIMETLFGLAVLKAKTGNPSLVLLLTRVLMNDEKIGKDLKVKASDLIAEIQPSIGQSEAADIEGRIKSFTVESLAAYLLEN